MPCPREKREAAEALLIGPHGLLSTQSTGRPTPEPPCEMRTCFQRDVDRITHSKSFRRLKHKTQVFLRPEGDHYRTRLTHTLEVARLARTIARALELNEDLTEAISLGHDLGHTPFGHAGERALNAIYTGVGFRHYEQSLRVVDRIERDGRGLNLCNETRIGILNHTTGQPRGTLEADVVRLADRVAYINHDLDDAMRGGIVQPEDVPAIVRERVGERNSVRINSILTDIIAHSGDGELRMSPICARPWTCSRPSCMRACTTTPSPRARSARCRISSGASGNIMSTILTSSRWSISPSRTTKGRSARCATMCPA